MGLGHTYLPLYISTTGVLDLSEGSVPSRYLMGKPPWGLEEKEEEEEGLVGGLVGIGEGKGVLGRRG